MLSIRLFGSPQLSIDGRELKVARRKSRALLYYLAAHARPLAREHLLAFFWPDRVRATAQQILRTTLHTLRQSVGAALESDSDMLSLSPSVDVDARRFEATILAPDVGREALREALDLYRGDFLADFSLRDLPEFDDWVSVERERYRRLLMRGALALAQRDEREDDYAAALDVLNRALDIDALQEEVLRAVLRVHYAMGDRAGAVRRYEQFRERLDAEMGVLPAAETRALYDAIITDTLAKPGSPVAPVKTPQRQTTRPTSQRQPRVSTLPFTGRAAELQALRAVGAANQLALIEGEPGIGKTRLAEEFIAARDALTLIGRARELEHAFPYQPVIEALRDWLARNDWNRVRAELNLLPVWQVELARLLPELAAPETVAFDPANAAPLSHGMSESSRLWEGLWQLLLALTRRQPLILFLDDLHWADVSTLTLLGYLVRQAAAANAPLTFVATARQFALRSPLATLVQALTREGRIARLALERLSRDETTQLAQQLSPAFAYPLGDWLARASEGNPYILSELVREARSKDILQPGGVLNLNAITSAPVVPPTVYSLIQSRLSTLSDAARRLLDAAVAVGREFESELVQRAAGLDENELRSALDELRAAALIYPSDNARYAFDHTLTMEVAYREAGEPRHRAYHRRVAEALESLHGDRLDSVAGLLAWHFDEGNVPERAAPYALRAGKRAAQLPAWSEAIAFYEQALRGERDEARRREIYVALGEAHQAAGQAAQAVEAFHAALALADAAHDAHTSAAIKLSLGRALVAQARFAEVVQLAQAVLATDEKRLAAAAEIMWGAALSLEGADLAGAAEHLQRAAALQTAQDDPVSLAHIRFELGSIAAQQGELERAVASYREALEIARTSKSSEAAFWEILAQNNLAYHLHLLNDPGASEHARAGLSLAQEKGMLPYLPYLYSTLGEIALARHELPAAEAHFKEGLALAERLGMPERIAGLTANLGRLEIERGEKPLGIHHLSTALARADALGLQHLGANIRLWLAPVLPPQEARAILAEARAIAERGKRRRLLDEVEKLEIDNAL